MTEKEKERQILKNFAVIMPKISRESKEYLLGLGEGMAIATGAQEKKEADKTAMTV